MNQAIRRVRIHKCSFRLEGTGPILNKNDFFLTKKQTNYLLTSQGAIIASIQQGISARGFLSFFSANLENYGILTKPGRFRPFLLREAFIMKNSTAWVKASHKGSTPH
ncbi:hypothetical protein KJK41_03850 [Bacillus haikouensis]|nr:hypothetical protein KJK41_03850 [Bacillus haikouensis]